MPLQPHHVHLVHGILVLLQHHLVLGLLPLVPPALSVPVPIPVTWLKVNKDIVVALALEWLWSTMGQEGRLVPEDLTLLQENLVSFPTQVADIERPVRSLVPKMDDGGDDMS